MKKIPIILSIIVFAIIPAFLFSSCFLFNRSETGEKDDLSDLIIVTSPQPDELIESPLIIEGRARSTWFFEGDFPIMLFDANGNPLARYFAQAQGEWMTEDFVSFTSQIEFEDPSTDTGVLVLEKNNPSGLAENDAKIEIPVRFKHPENTSEGTEPAEGEYFTGAILKSIDTGNNKIIVEQLINDPDEIIIEPEVMLSEDCEVIKSILNIETGEEKSSSMALENIPLGSEIGILFNKDDTAKLIIYQELVESDDNEMLEEALFAFFSAVEAGDEYKCFSSATVDIVGTEAEYKNGDKSDIYFIIQESHSNWENIEILDISMDDNTANVAFIGEREVEGIRSEGLEVSFDFVKENGKWKIDFS